MASSEQLVQIKKHSSRREWPWPASTMKSVAAMGSSERVQMATAPTTILHDLRTSTLDDTRDCRNFCVISHHRKRTNCNLSTSRPKSPMFLFIHLHNHHLLIFSIISSLVCAPWLLAVASADSSSQTASSAPPHTSSNQNATAQSTAAKQENTTTTTTSQENESRPQLALDCQPGEQRQFSYESSTRVWGSSEQQVRLRATLRLKCMEPPSSGTLKYLAEIVSVRPNFVSSQDESLPPPPPSPPIGNSQLQAHPRRPPLALPDAHKLRAQFSTVEEYARRHNANNNLGAPARQQHQQQQQRVHEAEVDQVLRAEPLLEEVGEVASRMRRSVSGWFSKAWGSVRDFFGNIFTSSERSSVSREQVFKESGLDIAGQCRAPSSSSKDKDKDKGKGAPQGLPFDESVFEDLGPEYYVGASLDGTSIHEFSSAGHVSTFGPPNLVDGDDPEQQDPDMMTLSFFDDPAPARRRAKRAPTGGKKAGHHQQPSSTGGVVFESGEHERLLKVPFVFLQSRAGKIVEIRFGQEEVDLSVKNFKRHLCDLFATNLEPAATAGEKSITNSTQNEVSPIGRHQTSYTLDASANSMDSIKRTMLRGGGGGDQEERSNKQQLVRVLATLGTTDRTHHQVVPGNHSLVGVSGFLDDDDEIDEGDTHQPPPSQFTSVAVMRSINTTSAIQPLGSKVGGVLAPEIERMQVRVKQMQQINEGRLVGTAGQLSMSLVQQQQQQQQAPVFSRPKRFADQEQQQQQVEDISDLLRVSTSFSMQLVPIPRKADGSVDDSEGELPALQRSRRMAPSQSTDGSTMVSSEKSQKRPMKGTKKFAQKEGSRNAVKLAPADAQELQRVLQDWRRQEARLQMSAANLVAESNGLQESQATRLEIMRDQVRQRLNEEFVRNRIRRSLSLQQVAVSAAGSSVRSNAESSENYNNRHAQQQQLEEQKLKPPVAGDLGLGLTQLVLGTGVTTKRKGSIYGTLEEIVELEAQLGDEQAEAAISRLMRDTLKMDKLRQHCRAAVPSLAELQARNGAGRSNLVRERRLPFGLLADYDAQDLSERGELRDRVRRARQAVEQFARQNERKLDQCQAMLRLALRLNERQAVDLTLELIDECNARLLAAAKQEELGYGPMSKYLRRLRQQLVELLGHVSRPSDSLLDKLLARLYHYPKLVAGGGGKGGQTTSKSGGSQRPQSSLRSTTTTSRPEPEFVYIDKKNHQGAKLAPPPLNKSLLREEDDANNNDGAGLLVMTLTSLAAKPSISHLKRLEVAEKLLGSLKGTTCSLFDAPDLDILESMGSFAGNRVEPLDEIVGRILQLARKCKAHDQYVAACVHGLAGQLQHAGTQRFLADLLRSRNASCTLKSEVLLTLIGAQLAQELSWMGQPPAAQSGPLDHHRAEPQWPSAGHNKVDEILEAILAAGSGSREWERADRRCLAQLATHYFSKKRRHNSDLQQVVAARATSASTTTTTRRLRRAVVNEQNFWDDAQCKRWTVPADYSEPPPLYGDHHHHHLTPPELSTTEDGDEIDDNSILSAISHSQREQRSRSSSSASRRQQKLIERELDSTAAKNSSSSGGSSSGSAPATGGSNNNNNNNNSGQQQQLRRRQKCVASKDFGPRNAQANLRAEIVNDLVGARDENKFLARFRLATTFLGQRIDVGRMYLWHQRRTTRAYANILGRSIWDSSHGCRDKPPAQTLYLPLFDFNLWLVKVSVGLRLHAEMGFYPNCDQSNSSLPPPPPTSGDEQRNSRLMSSDGPSSTDELQLFPTVSLRAAGEATAKLVVARAGMSLASQYSYQGDIRVSRQPDSCMSIYSAHQPMNITFASWYQLWDNDCHFWGSRSRAEPQATKWRLSGRKPIAWLENECLGGLGARTNGSSAGAAAKLTPPATRGISP